MSRPTDRLYHFDTRVVRATQLTPRMRRITVSCPELAVCHVENGPNIKLYFPLPDGGRASRAYTVRHFRRDALELDIDFLLHEPDGAASLWARHAQPGDQAERQIAFRYHVIDEIADKQRTGHLRNRGDPQQQHGDGKRFAPR